MRDTPLSNCERSFLLKAIEEKKVRVWMVDGHNSLCFNTIVSKYSKDAGLLLAQRLDGRQTYDYRRIKISFGADYGCCFVELGETR